MNEIATSGGVGARPRVLVVTTNFPFVARGDRTSNFVVDPVLAVAGEVDVHVVTPLDSRHGAPRQTMPGTRGGAVRITRAAYVRPRRWARLAEGDGIPTNLRHPSPVRRLLAWLQLPLLLGSLMGATWRHARDADVIHAHWLPVAMLCRPAARRHGLPLLVTLHGSDVTQFPDRLVRWMLGGVDVVVTAHDDLAAEVRRLAPDADLRIVRHLVEPQAVPDGAADELCRRLPGDGPLAVFVARLSPERDPLAFVRAIPIAQALVPEARFAIVGDGPLRDEVETAVRALGLPDGVVAVFGHRPDVWTFLEAGDVFGALSDRTNVWVTAVVEAMRAGLAVVATDAGLTATTLTDGVDARVVPVGDEQAIGQAIGELLADPAAREAMAAAARDTLAAAGFDPDVVVATTTGLYDELAGRSR